MSSSRRKMLFNSEQNKEPDNNENNNNKFYIFKEGQIINGELVGKTGNIIIDNCIYVNGTSTTVRTSGPSTYVFPAKKGYTSAQDVVDYYKEQGYDIDPNDITESEFEDQTYFVPNLDTYQTHKTIYGGSVGLHDYELEKYKSINFNIIDLKGSGSLMLEKSLNSKRTPGNQISGNNTKEMGKINSGKNSFSLIDVEGYSIIYFKCSDIGKPVYKITEIYLEE